MQIVVVSSANNCSCDSVFAVCVNGCIPACKLHCHLHVRKLCLTCTQSVSDLRCDIGCKTVLHDGTLLLLHDGTLPNSSFFNVNCLC